MVTFLNRLLFRKLCGYRTTTAALFLVKVDRTSFIIIVLHKMISSVKFASNQVGDSQSLNQLF